MKNSLIFLALALATVSISGQQTVQQLSVGNADQIVTETWPYNAQIVEADQNSFYWISGSYFSSISHPLLTEVYNDFANVYFIKYDETGAPVTSNFLRGTYRAVDAFSFQGGIRIFGTGNENVTSEGDELLIDNADMMEFIASYDNSCKLQKLIKIWNLQPSQYPYSSAVLDEQDGSIYVYGIYYDPLEVFGYGMIGEEWLDSYIYVIKYNGNLELQWAFTSGFSPDLNETGYFQHVTVQPAKGGDLFVSGSFDAIGMGPIIEGDILPSVEDGYGLFGFRLDPTGKKIWTQHGVMKGSGFETGIYKGFAMDDGGLVLAGVTTTGYFQLGNMEVIYENGLGNLNQFVFRMASDGEPLWITPFETMAAIQEGKKGTQEQNAKKGTQSDWFSSDFFYDAFDWNKQLLYLTGKFDSDAFEVAGRILPKKLQEGMFVASIDLEEGSQQWGYSLSATNLGINGFDGDRFGNVMLMGYTSEDQDFEGLGMNTVVGKELIFHLGLNYNGSPMWLNNAFLQQNAFQLYGDDLEVLANGQVFSSMAQEVADIIEVGQTTLSVDASYANWLVAFNSDLELSGMVTDESGSPIYPGTVKVYKSAVGGEYPSVDSVALNDGGDFVIPNVWPGRMTLQVKADELIYPDGVPTYLGDQYMWAGALFNDYGPEDKLSTLDITLMQAPKPTPEDGSGVISGYVSYEEEGELKGTMARPVKKASALVARKPKDTKSTHEDEILTFVETDDFGNFQFENIPDGDYLLLIDIAGLDMLETHEVTIQGSQIKSGFDYTVGPSGIYTWTGVGIQQEEAGLLKMFPNPGNGLIYIELPATGNYHVNVFSPDGRRVFTRDFYAHEGIRALDLSLQREGIYLIHMDGPNVSTTFKYLKK